MTAASQPASAAGGPGPLGHDVVDGGTTAARGFRAAAATGGLKASGAPDIALLVSDAEASAAGVFTRSAFAAAPVRLDRATLAASGGRARAVVANSGCANAVTGAPGDDAARAMQAAAAAAVGCAPDRVLVLSTGVIGVPLDVAKVERGVRDAARRLAPDGGAAAAHAILTTDTRPKTAARTVRLSGGIVVVGGMAKGAGMIHPDMATMLAVVTTDLVRAPDDLADDLRAAVAGSFNRISIDGDSSTNDSVLMLANGASGVRVDAAGGDDRAADVAAWRAALLDLCQDLARQIVRDGEGVRRLAVIEVVGAADDAAAHRVANTIATSPLVKTAFAGGDPNWGRIVAAAGRSGVAIDPARVGLSFAPGEGAAGERPVDGLVVLRDGLPVAFDDAAAGAILGGETFTVRLDLGAGAGVATVWTGDLTEDYIRINADYRT